MLSVDKHRELLPRSQCLRDLQKLSALFFIDLRRERKHLSLPFVNLLEQIFSGGWQTLLYLLPHQLVLEGSDKAHGFSSACFIQILCSLSCSFPLQFLTQPCWKAPQHRSLSVAHASLLLQQEGFGNPSESGSWSVAALVKMDSKGQLCRRRRGNAGTSLFYFTF